MRLIIEDGDGQVELGGFGYEWLVSSADEGRYEQTCL